MAERCRHPLALALTLVVLTAGIFGKALPLASESSGTGAVNVGDSGVGAPPEEEFAVEEPSPDAATATSTPTPSRPRNCKVTESNPGGDNNYIPDAPELDSLGSGFIITGRVRAARACEPLEGVRVQVWLATETGGEQDNRATVRTDARGRYRIETAPTIPQFGEPNIHVAYDGNEYRPVFIRRVVDLDDRRAVVNLTLRR